MTEEEELSRGRDTEPRFAQLRVKLGRVLLVAVVPAGAAFVAGRVTAPFRPAAAPGLARFDVDTTCSIEADDSVHLMLELKAGSGWTTKQVARRRMMAAVAWESPNSPRPAWKTTTLVGARLAQSRGTDRATPASRRAWQWLATARGIPLTTPARPLELPLGQPSADITFGTTGPGAYVGVRVRAALFDIDGSMVEHDERVDCVREGETQAVDNQLTGSQAASVAR